MGTLFRRTAKRPVPKSATVTEKGGKFTARWRSRGKVHTAPVTEADDGTRTVAVEISTYYARYRDHTGKTVERATGCRDESNARQKLAKWEKEAEQITAGVLDASELETARAASGPIGPHLDAYEQALTVRDVSDVYKANAIRAVRRLMRETNLQTLRDIRRDKIEPWFAKVISENMTARTRNYYRESILLFGNWLVEMKRFREHDLAGIPLADRRLDPRRQRRALTADEIGRLLAVAATRPLDDARTIRRGKRKGERTADVRPEVVERLLALGRERVLVYRTLIYTGLRRDELRTLTVSRLDLTPGAECIRLEAANEKNSAGSTIPLRSDLAADLRQWITEKNLDPVARLFTIPVGLRLILDRDMKAAGIPKRDERGRTVDVHAMRTTFATMLSTSGTAPRTAQAAMRHSDIKLTMGVYTDPKLLDVRQAVERLPELTSTAPRTAEPRSECSHDCSETGGPEGQFLASTDTMGTETNCSSESNVELGNAGNVNKKPPLTSGVSGGHRVGLIGFEPTTSWSRIKVCEVPSRWLDTKTQ